MYSNAFMFSWAKIRSQYFVLLKFSTVALQTRLVGVNKEHGGPLTNFDGMFESKLGYI